MELGTRPRRLAIDDDTHARLKAEAKARGRTIQWLTCRIIRGWLDRYAKGDVAQHTTSTPAGPRRA
jgi:hypothetical protein